MKKTWNYDELQKATREIAPNVYHSDYEGSCNKPVRADTLDTIIFQGWAVFARCGWTGYFCENPTVADVLKAMNQSMEELDDFHHSFYEGYRITESVVKPEIPLHSCSRCGHTEEATPATAIEIHTGS